MRTGIEEKVQPQDGPSLAWEGNEAKKIKDFQSALAVSFWLSKV